MQLTTKVLYATLVMILAFGSTQISSTQDNNLVQIIKQEQDQELLAQIDREERWMKEIGCLARNVYYEARGESLQGQMAVALVTLNRVESGMFPNTVCGVVNERKQVATKGTVCQFSWRCESHTNPQKHIKHSHESYQAALQAIINYQSLTNTLVTADTLFFHATTVRPFWRTVKQRLAKIDNHIFYEQKPGDTQR